MTEYEELMKVFEERELGIMLKTRECKKAVREALKLAKSGKKNEAEEKLEEAEDLLSEATEISADLFSEQDRDNISLRISFVLDSLADCQSTLELSREIMDLY